MGSTSKSHSLSQRKVRVGPLAGAWSRDHGEVLHASSLTELASVAQLVLILQPRTVYLGMVLPAVDWPVLHQLKITTLSHRLA